MPSQIQANPASVADTGVIPEFVVVYDRDGGQMILPHLNSKTVFALHKDVAELRALWERLRGEDWTALPKVAAMIARTRRHMNRQRGFVAGVAAWARVMVTGLVLILALLLTGALDGTGENTLTVAAVGFAVAGVAVGVVLGRRLAGQGKPAATPQPRRKGLHE
ncbi:hypothetical protein AV521_37990 [Streptomyces sp. IMTB 2501]|uniref:hypothetical protein n=1 Tax=Streptomyces sp. IMTB 2501 TaxID=1776340 RepID=UPI00096F36CA|nr:hypothetical protein [Streptomyces sp. IMTB 2501]OLZ63794.1 hypothetical protein AV521_37990 [Streptomyces sp. IMTB 2501]